MPKNIENNLDLIVQEYQRAISQPSVVVNGRFVSNFTTLAEIIFSPTFTENGLGIVVFDGTKKEDNRLFRVRFLIMPPLEIEQTGLMQCRFALKHNNIFYQTSTFFNLETENRSLEFSLITTSYQAVAYSGNQL